MLEIEDIHTFRGENYVLQGLNMEVPDGACTTVLGRNGMGKTTLMRSVMGLSPPREGQIRLNGVDLTQRKPFEIAQQGLALVPQGRHIFPSLSVEENLTLAARKSSDGGAPEWSLDRVYDLFSNLKMRRRNRGGQLSGGEQQMLAIARALVTNPTLLLLDEPFEGLAPSLSETLVESLIRIRKEGGCAI
ncbi:MAG: ABC transporter ATP-binding protein, partial [Candidatus Dormibacterales bacterium]